MSNVRMSVAADKFDDVSLKQLRSFLLLGHCILNKLI